MHDPTLRNPCLIVGGTVVDGLVEPLDAGGELFPHATPASASAVTMHANRRFRSLTRPPIPSTRSIDSTPGPDYRRRSGGGQRNRRADGSRLVATQRRLGAGRLGRGREGGIGRGAGPKNPWASAREGSIPSPGTCRRRADDEPLRRQPAASEPPQRAIVAGEGPRSTPHAP